MGFIFALLVRVLMVSFGAILLKIGFEESQVQGWMENIAELLTGIVAIVVTIFWAWWERKKSTLQLEKRLHRNPYQYVLPLLFLFTLGCGASPEVQLITAERLYTELAKEVQVAVETGKVDPEHLTTLRFVIVELDNAFNEAEDVILRGGTLDKWAILQKVNNALGRFIRVYKDVKPRKEISQWTPLQLQKQFRPPSRLCCV